MGNNRSSYSPLALTPNFPVMFKLPHVIAFFILVLAPGASGQDINYPDFSNTANLNLGGSAVVTPSFDLQLADGINSVGCGVHSIGSMELSFLTEFDFTITSNSDSLSFFFQTESDSFPAGAPTWDNGIRVELDHWQNIGDVSANFVRVEILSSGQSSVYQETDVSSISFDDGQRHQATIEYDDALLLIFFDGSSVPDVSLALDLASLSPIMSTSPKWAGLTAYTGTPSGSIDRHLVHNWMVDFFEDSDEDGLRDDQEDVNENGLLDPGETDPLDQDSDDDGLSDGEEVNTLRNDTRWIQSPSGDFYRLAPADNWSQARFAAVAQGYDLTSVQDQAEADWLYSTFGDINDGFWIGLNDFSAIFEWSDGSPVNYTQWATGEPNTTFVAAFVGGPSAGEPGNWYAEFAGVTPRLAVWESPGPNAPQTALDPLAWDTDGDGLGDGQEDGVDAIYWDGFGIAGVTGTDPLVFVADADPLTTTDPLDLDSDEDGIADGVEDIDGDGAVGVTETNPTLADTDGDTLPDGLELGFTSATLDTNGNVFVPDADPLTTTNPLLMDTDAGGVDDGIEDQNGDGAVNTWETDPNQAADDDFAFYVTNLTPGGIIHFKVLNASPNTGIFPAFSLTGAGPTMTTLGINVALSMPIKVLPPTLSNNQGTASWNGPRVPLSAQLGFGVYIQAIEVPVSSVQQPRTSNAVLLPVGAN